MKTKKTVIAVITAALLVSAMLILGCMSQIGEITVKDDDEIINYPIPEGKGIVRFKLADKNVRTIMPTFDDYDVGGNNIGGMYFEVKFTKKDNPDLNKVTYFPSTKLSGTVPPDNKADYDEVTGPIPLDSGEYSFEITAFNDIAGTIPIARYTSAANLTVTGNYTSTAGPFNLELIIGNDNGTLECDITIPIDTYSTSIVNIYAPSDLNNPINHIDLNFTTGITQEPKDLLSGYYIIKVIVAKQHYLTRQYTEALHIYPGFISKLELEVPALIQNEFEVSFDMNIGALSITVTNENNSAFAPQWIKNAKLATDPEAKGGLGIKPLADDPEYVFKGWFKESGTSNKWNFGTDWVIKTTTLFAKWIHNQGFNLNLSTPTDLAHATAVGGVTLLREHYNEDRQVTIKLNGPNPDGTGSWDPGSIWFSIDDDLDDDFGIGEDNKGDTNTLVITNGGIWFPLISDPSEIGTPTKFTVGVVAEKGGVVYSSKVEITVSGVYSPAP